MKQSDITFLKFVAQCDGHADGTSNCMRRWYKYHHTVTCSPANATSLPSHNSLVASHSTWARAKLLGISVLDGPDRGFAFGDLGLGRDLDSVSKQGKARHPSIVQ